MRLKDGGWLQGQNSIAGPVFQTQVPSNDTILDGLVYRNFERSGSLISFWFALRETPYHKVYLPTNNSTCEILIFVFNMDGSGKGLEHAIYSNWESTSHSKSFILKNKH